MANVIPHIINRLRASVVFADKPSLQIISNYITTEGIRIALEGRATDLIPAMMSLIASPAPYLGCTVTVPIIRSIPLAETYKATFLEQDTLLGLMTIYPDVDTISAFVVNNTALETVRDMTFAGTDAALVVTLRGYYQVNQSYYNSP
jgi:hypothetical protein